MNESFYKVKEANEYALSVIERKGDTITLTKDEFRSYIYWSFANGMNLQRKKDLMSLFVNKLKHKKDGREKEV